MWNKLSREKKKKRSCNSANLLNDLIPANTTGSYPFPDPIKCCRRKHLTHFGILLWILFLNKANFSGDQERVSDPTAPPILKGLLNACLGDSNKSWHRSSK